MRYIQCILLIGAGVVAAGCTPPPNGNSNDNSNAPVVVRVPLGDIGVFENTGETAVGNSGVLNIADQLPAETPVGATMSIDPADIAIGTASGQDAGTNGRDAGTNGVDAGTSGIDTSFTLLISFAPADASEPCVFDSTPTDFRVTVQGGEVTGLTPSNGLVSTTGLEQLVAGQFSVCVAASLSEPIGFTIEALSLTLEPPGPVTATSCAEILALSEVQQAIADLAAQGISFQLPTGDRPPDVEGDYTLTQVTTYDPDGANEGDTVTGAITLTNQTATTIRRTGFNTSIDQFITGDATSVGLCTLQRTNVASCDQTIARLESLTVDTGTGGLSGDFLSVAVRRHAFTDTSCGARGDFIYGTLDLATGQNGGQTQTGAQRLGKVMLPQGFSPDFIVLPSDGGNGTVTDFNSTGTVLSFATVDPFGTQAIALPDGLNPTGFSALGISADGTRLAVITNNPDQATIYDNATLAIVRANTSGGGDYLGQRVDFSLDDSRIYVPVTTSSFTDHIRVLRADTSSMGDELYRLSTPQGKKPVYARISPDGSTLAVLLEAGAVAGEANELTFLDTTRNNYSIPPVNLVDQGGGSVLATELVWSADSSQVFLAGLGAVLAVDAQSPFTVTAIDVSDGAGDNPISMALSNDGAVLAVAVDDANSTVDFAVVDIATLTTVHTQNVGFPERGVIGVAHFSTARVALLANFESQVVAVQTEEPYVVYDPLSAADDSSLATLDRMASGANVIAVTNIDEPAIYLYELP